MIFSTSRWGILLGGVGIGSWLTLLGFNAHRIRFYSVNILRNLNMHLHNELASMVYEHQRHMLENHQPLEKTMELAPQTAYLGELDIINSSSMVDQPGYEPVKNKIFEICYARMLRGYAINPQKMHRPICEGHLVKEMGDGFIFSVGFPFDVPTGKSGADLAFLMSLDFLRAFEAEITALDTSKENPRSVVVLTKSVVQAFWTSYKVKRYDLEQKCMTRVARLSEFRRALLAKKPELTGSFVLCDEAFAEDLSPALKEELQIVKLADFGFQIRNFPEISTVYVRALSPKRLATAA